jgi:hypothetical protein
MMAPAVLVATGVWQDKQRGRRAAERGIFGVALSPDGRTVVTISTNLEM